MLLDNPLIYKLILESAKAADSKMRIHLVNMVKEILLKRIKVNLEGDALEKTINLCLLLLAVALKDNWVGKALLEGREEEKMKLLSLYREKEPSITQMSGRQLYELLKALRNHDLRELLKRIPTPEPIIYMAVPIYNDNKSGKKEDKLETT